MISFLYCFLNAEVQAAISVHWSRWKLVRSVGRESSFTQSSFFVSNLGLGSSASVTATSSQPQVQYPVDKQISAKVFVTKLLSDSL